MRENIKYEREKVKRIINVDKIKLQIYPKA